MTTALAPDIRPWETGSDLRGFRCLATESKAAVLVVHGFGEHAMRHATTMRRWAARGFTTFAYDQRGHGTSPGKRAIVERIDDLVDDTLALRARIAAEAPELPLFLFGVSMGGMVVLRSAQRDGHGLRGVVALAPALSVAEHIPAPVRGLLRIVRRVAPAIPLAPVKPDALSRDPSVGVAYAADPLTYHGGVPLCSAVEVVGGGEAALADAATYGVPTLILQGDADTVLFPIGATRFRDAATTNRDLTLTVVSGGYHELFNDPGGETLVDSTADWMLARV